MSLLGPDILNEELTDYVNFFHETELYEMFVIQAMRRNPRVDESLADEVTLCAIWKSFYVIPWGREDLSMQTVKNYIFTDLKQLANNSARRKSRCDSVSLSDAENVPPDNQHEEESMIEAEDLEELVNGLLEAANVRADEYKASKRMILESLAQGMSCKDVSQVISQNGEVLSLTPDIVKRWIRRFKATELVGLENRIETRVDTSWRWTPHTAAVLLADPVIVKLLRPNELKFLEALHQEGSVDKVANTGEFGTNISNLQVAILHGVRSNWTETRKGETTRTASGRILLRYLHYLDTQGNVFDDDEEDIVRALIGSNGNQTEAAKELDIASSEVVSFLLRKGYYDQL